MNITTNSISSINFQGACTELIIVSGFIVFLPKYLETQFNLSKSMVSNMTHIVIYFYFINYYKS